MLELLKPCQRPVHADAIIAVSCMRNESLRIPYFLEYYRQLGIEHFVVVDNCSDDGSAEMLAAQTDVTLYRAPGRYSESHYGVNWLNEALSVHCCGRWALTVDADELLVYPNCERHTLLTLTEYLGASGRDSLTTFMLDMYSNRPIRDVRYQPGRSFLDACRLFDSDGYDFGESGAYGNLPVRGGPRKRLFWSDGQSLGNPPFLGKTPLVKWRDELRYEASTHTIHGLRRAEETGVLLHFKLFSDFADAVEREAVRAEHWQQGVQYSTYNKRMRSDPALSASYAGSIEYEDSLQLVKLGLLRTSSSWQARGNPAKRAR